MGRRRHYRGDLPVNADINVTSLVDVAFVLLVIFIIIAPAMQGGVQVDLPRADVAPLPAGDDPVIITVQRDSRVFIEETVMSVDEFTDGSGQMARAGGFQQVYIRGDSLVAYGPILKVIGAIARSGVNFALVGEERPRRR
jgi:biopolymer transport protein ExbD